MRETNHDYQGCLCGNYYNAGCTGRFDSWDCFKDKHAAFIGEGYDDTYHYVFRYDINKKENGKYQLELCVMLQRKGVYTHLFIENIDQELLDSEISEWLADRRKYILAMWDIEN